MTINNWVAGVSGNWGDAANWDAGAIPIDSDDTSIVQDGTYSVLLDVYAVVASLTLGGVTGSQTLNINNNTLKLDGASTVNSTGIFNLNDGMLAGGGDITFAAGSTFNWTSGGMTDSGIMTDSGLTIVNGSLNLSGDGRKFLERRRNIFTAGTTTWSGNTVIDGNILSLQNVSGISNSGTWEDQNTFDTRIDNLDGTGNFFNSGTYQKSGANKTSIGAYFNNTGTVDIQGGTLSLSGDSVSTGTFSSAVGTTLEFGSTTELAFGTHDITSTTEVNAFSNSFGRILVNAGSGRVNMSGVISHGGLLEIGGGTFNINGVFFENDTYKNGVFNTNTYKQSGGILGESGTLNVAGAADWTGGEMTGGGVTNFNGALNISGDDQKFIANMQSINTKGTTIWGGNTFTDGNIISLQKFSSIDNSGTWEDQNTFDTQIHDIDGKNIFVNGGTYLKSGISKTFISTGIFYNVGTVDIQNGTLEFFTYKQIAGKTQLNGGSIEVINPLSIQDGSVVGSGTITGNVDNTGGRMSPGLTTGTLGNLVITGNYSESDTSNIDIEIGGGTTSDQLQISGSATLDGTVNISRLSSFTPVGGDRFSIMTFGSILNQAGLSFTGLNISNLDAVNDALRTDEDTVLNGNLLTNDIDSFDFNPIFDTDSLDLLVQGGGKTVTAVNGNTAAVGTQIALASGALLTLNANGTFSYNPNGSFNSLAAGATTPDSFTYTILDDAGNSDTATVTLSIDGKDSAVATPGPDNILGTTGNDIINGLAGDDTLRGLDGNDALVGGLGDDELYGDAGNDSITGGDGQDYVEGGVGNDTMYGGSGNDEFYGEDGDDDLYGGDGDDWLEGGAGQNYIEGGAGDDTIYGGNDNDEFYGSAGNDFLDGGAGDDWLEGGAGNDTLIGGVGEDSLIGGAGVDVFVLNKNSVADFIYDFMAGTDKLEVSASTFGGGLVAGLLSGTRFISGASVGAGSATGSTGQFLYNTTSGDLYFDANGSNSGVGVKIATLTTNPGISTSDFSLVA
jgi:Ca2+-binding RTX toxin-like protein